LKPSSLELFDERTIALTYDNNLVYFDSKKNSICCYGLIGKKLVFEKNVQDFSSSIVTRIVVSLDNESYFIGCKDGSVHVIRALDFKHMV
jgi:hypothetical protein